MALKKQFTDEEGRTAEYWRIGTDLSYDLDNGVATCSVLLYASAAARQAGRRSIAVFPNPSDANAPPRAVQLSGQAALDALKTGDTRPAMYLALKQHPFFSGSEDV